MSHDAQGRFKLMSQEEKELTEATRSDLIYKHVLAKKSQSSEKTMKRVKAGRREAEKLVKESLRLTGQPKSSPQSYERPSMTLRRILSKWSIS